MDLSDPVEVVAGTAWGENRSGGVAGMQSVCNVIMNRANHPRWWGKTPLSVCLEPEQFSCWNSDDPNRAKIMTIPAADTDFAVALGLARQAIGGVLPDITKGADSYYDLSMGKPPTWAARAAFCGVVAGQGFYRVELPAPGAMAATHPSAPNVRGKTVAELVPGAAVPHIVVPTGSPDRTPEQVAHHNDLLAKSMEPVAETADDLNEQELGELAKGGET